MRVEELRIAKAKVAGSNPVFRSKKSPILLAVASDGWGFLFCGLCRRWRIWRRMSGR